MNDIIQPTCKNTNNEDPETMMHNVTTAARALEPFWHATEVRTNAGAVRTKTVYTDAGTVIGRGIGTMSV